MPLTPKGGKIMSAMQKEYGLQKGKRVFYASRNKGKISGVDIPRRGSPGSRKNPKKASSYGSD
jgi:hypothetical protein